MKLNILWRNDSGFAVGGPEPGETKNLLPEFGRWQDVQRLFGLKRGTLYNLMAEGLVKSVSIRRKGNVHGCRLFFLPGIRDLLNSLMAEQQPNQKEVK